MPGGAGSLQPACSIIAKKPPPVGLPAIALQGDGGSGL